MRVVVTPFCVWVLNIWFRSCMPMTWLVCCCVYVVVSVCLKCDHICLFVFGFVCVLLCVFVFGVGCLCSRSLCVYVGVCLCLCVFLLLFDVIFVVCMRCVDIELDY